ncbi:MAG: anthranilate synthase component I [Armatimonadota bacterium]|nr:anthranilate synthase component I [Armatimonadota bacterium]MDR7438531.1 anthranilate synthase component I [Armatimonadota bacterium]MDR7562339.1 anthranilate synthase component I [Armatimonadota bacterium]MDR7601903.1 anthranilate synthase component I [Armatimonadota bacterium]
MRTLEITPGPVGFEAMLREGNLVPVSCELLADLETPISAFLKLRDLPDAFLLESVEGGERLGRYSFLGARPKLVLTYDGRVVHCSDGRTLPGPFLPAAREVLRPYRQVPVPGLPRFTGGLVGYLGYDLVRDWERLPHRPPDDLGLPVCRMGLFDTVVVFDHVRRRIRILANAFAEEGAKAAYRSARERMEEILERLHRPVPRSSSEPRPTPEVRSNMTREAFLEKVARGLAYVRAGDIFQVILSQRFTLPVAGLDPFLLYRAARAINPSPFLFYLDFPTGQLAGSSPELLVRLEGDRVMMRPIAGTRPRGRTQEEDEALEADLRGSEKERAEHVMLVDLTRNDLGRISRYGTVRTTELMVVERYSHVMHLVSTVQGTLQPGRDALDVLQAVFPHGTVSGAPKVRAMEIIDELEPVARGPYAGAVGYVAFSGALDTCITIRTLVVRDGVAYVQAGAGIVADSDPETEYRECVSKAEALVRAVELACTGGVG